MEEQMRRNEPSEIILLNAAKAIDEIDKIRISLGAEDLDMLTLCGSYTMPLCAAFYSLIGLAGTALGFIEIPEGATKKLVKGSPLDDDYFSMERDEFTMMIYRCRNDTVMLHCIFECFVKRDKDAMAAVAKDFVYYL